MKNWVPFLEKEYDLVWEKIYKDFKFIPSISKFPAFEVPHPFITFDISVYFGESITMEAFEDLEQKALDAFKENTSANEYMLALDWQHECYWINPRLPFEKDDFGEWTIPIFPNGDYYFFIHKNFEWGLLGHPWEKSITIFGEGLIDAFDKHKPEMFQKILRQGFALNF